MALGTNYALHARGLPYEVRAMIWDFSVPAIDEVLPYCGSTTSPRPIFAPNVGKDLLRSLSACLSVAQSCQEARLYILNALFLKHAIVLQGNPFNGLHNLSTLLPPRMRHEIKELTLSRPQEYKAWVQQYYPRYGDTVSQKLCALAQDLGFTFNSIIVRSDDIEYTEGWVTDFFEPLIRGQLSRIKVGFIGRCTDEACLQRCRLHQRPVVADGRNDSEPFSWGSRCPGNVHDWMRKFEQLAAGTYEAVVGDAVALEMRFNIDRLWRCFCKRMQEGVPVLEVDSTVFLEQSQQLLMECETTYPIKVKVHDRHLIFESESPESLAARLESLNEPNPFEMSIKALSEAQGVSWPDTEDRRARLKKMVSSYRILRQGSAVVRA